MLTRRVAEIAPQDRTVPAMLRAQAQRWQGQPLFACGGAAWNHETAPDIAARMAGALQAVGIGPGDRVAILAANRPEVMQVILGCGWCGAISVPLNVAVKARQLRYYLENSGARLLVAEAELLAALDADVFRDLPLAMIWSLGAPAFSAQGPVVHPFPVQADAVAPSAVRPGDPLAILYTSGTTGAPKGVVCPQAQFYWWAHHTAQFLEIVPGDVLATTLPLFHTNAINCFFQALLTGACQVVLPRFSASGYWRQMAEANATVGYLLGAMVPMLMAQPPSPAERAHRLRVALGPGVPPAMHATLLQRTGVRLVDGFGSTETNFIIGGTAAETVGGRMGRCAPGFVARVVDAEDNAVADGTPGELVVRADEPFAFAAGYFGLPDKTVDAWRNLWFHTGDRVVRHDDGTFSFLDRLKDVIRRRGENVSSFEVEQVIAALSEIESVAVYPVPSDLAEDEIMAAIVLRAGASLDPDAFFAHCRRELPRHAVPRYLRIVPDMPRTENGKIQKFRLRDIGVTADTVEQIPK